MEDPFYVFVEKSRNLICQAIGSIGSFSQEAIHKVMPDILSVLRRFDKSSLNAENSTLVRLLHMSSFFSS